MSKNKMLIVHGTYNIRDLGGLITSGGQSIKPHVLLRSGNLDKLPKDSQQQLIDYGVKTVIDLREAWEAEYYPNVFENSDWISYHNLPFIGETLSNDADWQRESGNYVELHELYIKYVDRCQSQIKQIFSLICERETGIVIHCHAGKDRTGIIIALLLASIGIPDQAIAADYALSRQNIEHLAIEWRKYALENGRDLEQLERDAGSLPETILQMLETIRNKYRSVDEYLKECGISEMQLKQVKKKFVA